MTYYSNALRCSKHSKSLCIDAYTDQLDPKKLSKLHELIGTDLADIWVVDSTHFAVCLVVICESSYTFYFQPDQQN